MERKTFDAIVIGTGQSGAPLASRMTEEGLSVAVIERGHFGGTCVNTGCVPTKTLVASARVAHMVRRAREFGIVLDGAYSVDMMRVKARKDEIVTKGRTGIMRWMEGLSRGEVIRGHARFTGPRTVEVAGRLLESDRIIINTGGRAATPPVPGLDTVPYLTNATVLDLTELPEHLVIIGGSYIGLEFAQVYRRFGSKVTVVEMADRLIPREDVDVSEGVREILAGEGIDIRLGAQCVEASSGQGGITVGLACGDDSQHVAGTHLLLATGRRPNTDDLGLEAAGVATDRRGYIVVDDQCRTNVPGIWAIGDVNGRGAFTHTSYNDYEVVAANMFEGADRRISDRITCYALFIDPPLGRVGLTENEVRSKGMPALKAGLPMRSVGRARERSETDGFMKILVAADTKRILGAACLGIEGDEVVQALLGVMASGAPYTVITEGMYIHPTVAEYLPVLLNGLETIP